MSNNSYDFTPDEDEQFQAYRRNMAKGNFFRRRIRDRLDCANNQEHSQECRTLASEALKCYKIALRHARRIASKNPQFLARNYHMQADAYRHLGRHKRALALLQLNWRISVKQYGSGNWYVALITLLMGQIMCEMHDLLACNILFKDALQIYVAKPNQQWHESVIGNLRLQAINLHALGHHSAAEALERKADQLSEAKVRDKAEKSQVDPSQQQEE